MTARSLLLSAAGAALAAAALAAAPSAPAPRQPLAVELGLVPPPAPVRAPEAARRAAATPEALLRLPPDDLVAALIDSTSTANVAATIGRLERFVSRYVVSDSCLASGLWVRDRFIEMGYEDVRLDTFRTWTFQDSVFAVNVLAVKPGTARPNEYVVLGGHYDSVTTDNFENPDAPAPGADDNATGVAGVLEAARVLRDVATERSVVFACWSAEEVGLWGSRAWVADAVASSLDIALYLNMDCIGYDGGQPIEGVIYADSLAAAVGAYMADVAARFLGIPFTTTVQPVGASDQNSFWEAGYRVVDTSPDTDSPYYHTPLDRLENTNPALARALAAMNIVGAAAVAGIAGEDANLPPETTLVLNCAATHDVVTRRPTFEWEGVDFDGAVEWYEYRVQGIDDAVPPEGVRDWVRVPAATTSVSLDLSADSYEFQVRALDDRGATDASPARHVFSASDTLAPSLTVATNFLPEPLVFTRRARPPAAPTSVFENELLRFTVTADASSYCGAVDGVEISVGDTSSWDAPGASPRDFTLRPAADDTVVFFRTADENGCVTLGRLALGPVPAPMDLPLLHVDDWLDGDAPEGAHDAFYEVLLSHQTPVEWDPIERMGAGLPPLPTMEELGRYATVFWTADRTALFLRAEQSRPSYHFLEGYVRAGGNLVVEGPSSLASLDGRDAFTYRTRFAPGDFVYDHAGIDSLTNAGGNSNPSWPDTYGWAFLGGMPAAGWLPGVPVDTLGKWADWYEGLGGIPWCEVARPTQATTRLYVFDSYLNPTLDERPCATARFPTEGTGTVAWFGFPLYYLRTPPAVAALDSLFARVRDWQGESDLLSFSWSADPAVVSLTWYLSPPYDGTFCEVERTEGPAGAFVTVSAQPVRPDAHGWCEFADVSVEPGAEYAYRIAVTERWGGVTRHGPWDVTVPSGMPPDDLAPPRPNPTASAAALRYSVGADHRWVSVAVYDVTGRLVRQLFEGAADAGVYERTWDLTNEAGDRVAGGVYFARVTIGPASLERKLVVLR